MSAFIVNDYHVSVLIQYAAFRDVKYFFADEWHNIKDNEQDIFSKLVRANWASVNHRYNENTPAMPGKYTPDYNRVLSAIQVIQGCNCFAYQSNEIDNWEETEAYSIIQAIRECAIRKLPGLDETEWEIQPRAINKNIVRII